MSDPSSDRRYVGDPVDVVTGAETHHETDFRLPAAAVPFSWVRHYDSRRCKEDAGALGPGFRLALNAELSIDLDGITYGDGLGMTVSFPFLTGDGQDAQRAGHVLERVDARSFLIHPPGDRPSLAFVFGRDSLSTPPSAMRADRGRGPGVRFTHDAAGLAGVDLGRGERLIVEREGPRVRGVVFLGATNEKKHLVRYGYDSLGRLVQVENAYGHVLRYEYDAAGRLARKMDRRGYSFLFTYDSAGRCVHTRGEDGVADFRLEYRPEEGLTIVTRGDGAQTRYFYDREGALVQIIDPCGGLSAFIRDGEGRAAKEIDPRGNETLILHDADDIPVAKRDPLGHARALPADPTPHPLDHFLPSRPSVWEHGQLCSGDARATPRTVTSTEADSPASVRPSRTAPLAADSLLPRWALQAVGPSPAAALEPITHVVDLQGVPLRDQRGDGKVRRWGLDPNGNLRWRTDFDGNTTHYEFGSWNLLRSQSDALDRLVQFDYTVGERRAAVTDPGGTRTEFAYDAKDRLIEVRRHGRVRDRYVYDAADNLIEKRTGDGELVLGLTIGRGGLVTRRQLGSTQAAWQMEYDKRGHLIEATGPAGTCTFAYDQFGSLTCDQRDGVGVRHDRRAGHGASTSVAGRFVTEYIATRDGGMLVRDPGDQVHRLRQIGPGLMERLGSNGVRELSHYDLHGRCLLKVAEGPTFHGGGWARRFTYSAEGDLERRDDTMRGAVVIRQDQARRLASVTNANGAADVYGYDRADNLLVAPGLTVTMQSGNRLSSANGDAFAYDNRDRIARRTTLDGRVTSYVYDDRDHLIGIDAPGLTYRARHDALGRRTEKTVNERTWKFYWDDDRLIAEVSPTGTWRVYVYPAAGALVPMIFIDADGLDAPPETWRRYHLYTDHLGCPELVLDDTAKPVWSARILPYGRARIDVGAVFHQPLRWPGHYHDGETDLHENRFRSYSPELGRYLQGDPAGLEGGLNLYAYTENPLRAVDLDGLGQACPDDVEDCPHRKKGGPDQEGTGPKLPGVTEEERALAASDSTSKAAAKARKKVVKAFLAEHGQEWDPATKSFQKPTPKQIRDQLKGHDLNHPVTVGPPPACPSPQVQFQRKNGNQGSYYTDEGTSPSQVGISPYARGKDGRYESKEQKPYDVNQNAPYLQSTAAPVNDTWSVKGQAVPAKGGGVQRVVPNRADAAPSGN